MSEDTEWKTVQRSEPTGILAEFARTGRVSTRPVIITKPKTRKVTVEVSEEAAAALELYRDRLARVMAMPPKGLKGRGRVVELALVGIGDRLARMEAETQQP